jgi:hypothetical protein
MLDDFDAFVLGALLINQAQAQVIVPDFGFYGRTFHMALIRQKRLTAGVRTLSELGKPDDKFRQAVLLIDEKIGRRCVWEDARTLAEYAYLIPGTTAHTDMVQRLME